MHDDLQIAIAHHRTGRLAEAEAIYLQVLARDPRNGDVLNLLCVMACQRGRLEAAIEYGQRAVGEVPDFAESRVNLGEALRRAGRVEEALRQFERACELEPRHAAGWYNRAVALNALGRKAEALTCHRTAAELAPGWAEAHNNLGMLLQEHGDPAGAALAFQRAVALKPSQAEAYNNLGHALWRTGRHEEGLAAFHKAAALKPDLAAAHANAGMAHRKLGQRHKAVEALRRAIQIEGRSSWIGREYAMALLEVGDQAQAAAVCREAVGNATTVEEGAQCLHCLSVILAAGQTGVSGAAVPEATAALEQAISLKPDPAWQFELAAMRGERVASAPDAFVRQLFDEYAPRFEKHLVEELEYRVPELLAEAVVKLEERGALVKRPWGVLDLGCGTGRCGELFRPHARQVAGVDLSRRMIERCRSRGVYDELHVEHIVPALRKWEAQWDVMVAADLFIYVGALEEAFAAAARALRAGGVVAMSFEHHDGDGFVLHRRQRFAHSPAYVRKCAAAVGLKDLVMERAGLRKDVEPGWIVVLGKA